MELVLGACVLNGDAYTGPDEVTCVHSHVQTPSPSRARAHAVPIDTSSGRLSVGLVLHRALLGACSDGAGGQAHVAQGPARGLWHTCTLRCVTSAGGGGPREVQQAGDCMAGGELAQYGLKSLT